MRAVQVHFAVACRRDDSYLLESAVALDDLGKTGDFKTLLGISNRRCHLVALLSLPSCSGPALCGGSRSRAKILAVRRRGVVPAAGGRNFFVDLARSPGAFPVFVDCSTGLKDRIDNAPGLFHIVL